MKIRNFTFASVFLIAVISLAGLFSYTPLLSFAQNDLTPEQEAALRAELQQIEKEIAAQQTILTQKKSEGSSIARDIAILDAKIKEAQLKIKAHNIAIDKLGKDIVVKSQNILSLSERIENTEESIGDVIRKTDQVDDFSLAEAFLAKRNLSEFFQDFDTFESLQNSLHTYVDEISQAKNETETEKEQLDQKRNKEIDTRIDVEAEQGKIKKSEEEKKYLLSLNKQQQANYQGVISEKQKKANAIREALFKLRDSESIKFGDALQYATEASKVTNVRPALILAVLTQESNLGQNVGSCYLADPQTGAGIKISTGLAVNNVMKPTRDVTPFLEITEALGRDPYKTRVSCPWTVGYGGAMGPAQFIPSTWKLTASRIASALGKASADPWNPRDAFMASSIYMGDLGASIGGYTAERNAACRYYSGQGCTASTAFYGDQVVAKATAIQAQIDILNGV